jgi:type IV pilus assembly protein PilA
MKNSISGFTLNELLIVIAIIGILAAISWPYYEGYMIRARLTEVENAMSTVQSSVSSYHRDQETWPDCPSITEISNSLGVGVSSIDRIKSLSVDPTTGDITAIIQNVHAMVDNKTLMLRPTLSPNGDGSISWRWDWSADFPVNLRPKR